MTTIERIRVQWSGFVGGPGISTFYATGAAALVPQLRTFFAAITTPIPNTVHIDVLPTGDAIDVLTGDLVGGWSTSAVAQVVGVSGGVYSAESGGLVQWKTDTILSGRRLRGHTFLVPLSGDAYDTSGQVGNTHVTTIKNAAAALVTASAGNMMVYQRPRVAKPADGSRHAITARSGGNGAVTASDVRRIVTVLRSRRD